MIELLLGARDMSHTRLAYSPLWETITSLRVLQAPARHAVHLPWVRETRERVRDVPDLDLLLALVRPRGYLPDFLTPAPQSPLPQLAAELAVLAAATTAEVRQDLAATWPEGLPDLLVPLHDQPRTGLRAVARAVQGYADVALLPHWDRVRDLLEGDVRYRSIAMARGGAHELFGDLHPRISWEPDMLRVQTHHDQHRDLAGEGVLLVPSAFCWPAVMTISREPLQPTIYYPARGIALLWETRQDPAPADLRSLLGATRAQVLLQTAAPASTVELARRLQVTAGNVSQHLGVLRRAGLVSGHRAGPVVLYARTPLGDDLVGDRR